MKSKASDSLGGIARAMQHAGGQFDSPPQTARKLLDQLATPISKAEPSEHFIGPSPQLAAAKSVQSAVVNHVFHHRQLLVDAGRLKHNAELRANRSGISRRLGPRI
jgi:hypothetical protein